MQRFIQEDRDDEMVFASRSNRCLRSGSAATCSGRTNLLPACVFDSAFFQDKRNLGADLKPKVRRTNVCKLKRAES